MTALATKGGPFQLFPDLDPATEAALTESIRRHGVLAPIHTDVLGRVLDGHHRRRIALSLGLGYATVVHAVESEAHALELARTLNADRRHLTSEQRKQAAADLRTNGHSLRAIAGALGVDPSTVHRDLSGVAGATPETVQGQDGKTYPASRPAPKPTADTTEPDPTETVAEEPRPARVVEDFATWTVGERALLALLRAGETVVVNHHRHGDLIAWAQDAGLYERIDRKSPWGNPFLLGEDGDRATVIASYRDHYLPHKPSLLARLNDLRGKALGCWCDPEPCHGDVLKEWAER